MQKRIKLQKMLIASLAVIIAVLLIGLVVGRSSTVTVLIINSEQIDLTKPLAEQPEVLLVDKMKKEEYERFGGTIATSLEQIKGARLKFPLAIGSPVIFSALTKTDTAGTFAANTPKYHTTFKMPEITSSLPPGIQAGDTVDIDLLIANETKPVTYTIGPILQNVKVSAIEETTLYLMVSQRDAAMLTMARQVGSFVVQLPGQKMVKDCQEVKQLVLAEKEAEISNLAKEEAYNKLDAIGKEKYISELEEKYDFRLANAECFEETDMPTTLTSDLIIEQVEKGMTLSDILGNAIKGTPEGEVLGEVLGETTEEETPEDDTLN